MEPLEILQILRQQLDAVKDIKPLHYDSPERKAWEKDTVHLLQEHFGEGSLELDEFLSAALAKFKPHMTEAEWQDNYDYLLRNQAIALEKILTMQQQVTLHPELADAEADTSRELKLELFASDHPLLDPVEAEHARLPEAQRTAIIALENLLRSHAPWRALRQQLTLVLQADRAVATAVLRALPALLHLCERD